MQVLAGGCLGARREIGPYYCLESVPLAAIPLMRGSAPPPSRKLTEVPSSPPVLVEATAPEKYFARFTAVPLTAPGARMPGTLMFMALGVTIYLGQFDAVW